MNVTVSFQSPGIFFYKFFSNFYIKYRPYIAKHLRLFTMTGNQLNGYIYNRVAKCPYRIKWIKDTQMVSHEWRHRWSRGARSVHKHLVSSLRMKCTSGTKEKSYLFCVKVLQYIPHREPSHQDLGHKVRYGWHRTLEVVLLVCARLLMPVAARHLQLCWTH